MKFEEAIVALKEGKKIRHALYSGYFYLDHEDELIAHYIPEDTFGEEEIEEAQFNYTDIIAEDWEVVNE
jgi:hypothetical protein